MGKLFVRSLLSLCMLIMSGHTLLHAHAYEHHSLDASLEKLTNSTVAQYSTTVPAPQRSVLKSASSGAERRIFTQDSTISEKEEDDKRSSFKRNLAGSSYYAAIFYALSLGYFYHHLNDRLPSCKHLLQYSSHRLHLILRVFRI